MRSISQLDKFAAEAAAKVEESIYGRRTAHEDGLCITFNSYLTLIYQRYPCFTWTHVPNGGKRSKKTAGVLKAMGVRPGVWDYYFRSLNFHTTSIVTGHGQSDDRIVTPPTHWIEMKYGKNDLTDEQEQWRILLQPLGDTFAVCYSPVQALLSLEQQAIIPPGCFAPFGHGIRLKNLTKIQE